MSEVDAISQGTMLRGNIELWKKYVSKIRKNPFARFIINASFAHITFAVDPKQSVFYTHLAEI